MTMLGSAPRPRRSPALALAAPLAVCALLGCAVTAHGSPARAGGGSPARAAASGATAFLSTLGAESTLASTVPANGDANPYGVAVVKASVGRLHAGSVLVSNFNDSANAQGTGTTIEEISPAGAATLFADVLAAHLPGPCPGGVGLTTALAALPGGYVVVGSLPTSNGMSATARAGCLIVLDSAGTPVETIAGRQIAGPWDMTAVTHGSLTTLFVSNALVGGAHAGLHTIDNSTVVRIRLRSRHGRRPTVLGERVVADGIPWRDDPEALVIGPTGLALSPGGTLYLADTLANRITAIPRAMTRTSAAGAGGTTVSAAGKLKQPLGLALARNGDILATNAGDGDIVEISPRGSQLFARQADPKGAAGSLFGLALTRDGAGIVFVDDAENTLRMLGG